MKKFLVIILLTIGVHAFAGHETKQFLIQFATDEHALDNAALQKLNEVNAFLTAHPSAKIKLTGRTDFDGTIGYNLTLSRLRTAEVSEFLKTKGWQKAEINEKWVGELKPIAANTDDEGKALNRSVEILIIVLNYTNAEEWLKEKQEGYEETFKLNRSGQNTIITDNETEITIPSGAFTSPDGKPIDNKNLKIVIKEVNTTMDAILNQVYTMSGDKLLETGGMINIEAYSNNTKLEMADGKEISIKIPTEMQKNDMMVFEGVADNTGKIDWKNTGKPFETNAQKEKVSKKLNEEILLSLIRSIDLSTPEFTDHPLNYTLPVLVNIPSKPRMPKEPAKPEARELFSFLGWIVSTQKMKENKVEKVYTAQMAEYTKRLEKYNKRLERYELFMANRKAEIEKFEAEKQLFYEWLTATRSAINKNINSLYDLHDKRRVAIGLAKLRNQSIEGTQYSMVPLRILKMNASNARLTEEETLKLNYLNSLNQSFSNLQKTDYPDIIKKYSRNGKLRLLKLKSSDINSSYQERVLNNWFLNEFIIANKSDFEEVFGNEMNNALMAAENQRSINKQNEARQYFTGNSSKLGWINCDRFVTNQLVNVSFTRLQGAFQAVIINRLKSVLNTSYYSNYSDLTFASVPVNEKFKLITLKIEGDQAYFSIIEATAEPELTIEPIFKKIPVDEVDKLLAGL